MILVKNQFINTIIQLKNIGLFINSSILLNFIIVPNIIQ